MNTQSPQLVLYRGQLRGRVCLDRGSSIVVPCRLSDLPEQGRVELVAQVLKSQRDGSLLVWDGTVHPRLPTWYLRAAVLLFFLLNIPSSSRYLPCYSWLPLVAADDGLRELRRGQWVLFPSVTMAVREDRLGGSVDCWLPLPLEDPRVAACRADRAAQRAQLAGMRPRLARSLTTVTAQPAAVSSVAQVLAAAAHPTATFHCQSLRVLALPDDLREITQPYCLRCHGPGFVCDPHLSSPYSSS